MARLADSVTIHVEFSVTYTSVSLQTGICFAAQAVLVSSSITSVAAVMALAAVVVSIVVESSVASTCSLLVVVT